MKTLVETCMNNNTATRHSLSESAIVAELKKCRHRRDLDRGKLLHSYARAAGYHKSRYVANALISMYSRCSSLQEALDVFNTMQDRDNSSWNALILAYVENGEPSLALDAFSSLDCQPDTITYVAALKACGSLDKWSCSQKVASLHSQAVSRRFVKDIYVASTLVDVYCKCGKLSHAREIFDGMDRRNVVSWTAMILGYVENGESAKALEVFDRMDCEPNHVTFVALLKACTGLALSAKSSSERMTSLEKGVSIHQMAKERGFDTHIFVANTLIDMYSKFGDMSRAQESFNGLTQRSVVSWNALILGYVENGMSETALELFDRIDCAPDRLTVVGALKACVGMVKENISEKKTSLEKGISIHRLAKFRVLDKHILVANTLVDMYGKCGHMQCAREVFCGIVSRDAVSWTALISGYVENGENSAALEVFDSMDSVPDRLTYVAALKACAGLASSGKRTCLEKGMFLHHQVRERGFDKDVFVANTLVDMYSKAGDMRLAWETFEMITRRNVVSWNTLILGYVENSEWFVALELFESMDCNPDSLTFLAAAKACSGLAAERKLDEEKCLQKGLAIHARARELGFDKETLLANTLVDMYSKCGSMHHARDVFDRIPHRTDVSWTSLILGYMDNDMSFSALEAFSAIDCSPNRVSLVAALKSCASMGALEIGQRIHYHVCRLGLEHDEMVANCLVDFYAKCGDLSSAEVVFNGIPSRDIVSWNALMGGYSLLRDTPKVFALLKELHEDNLRMNDVTLLLVHTACTHAGMVEEGEIYFRKFVST